MRRSPLLPLAVIAGIAAASIAAVLLGFAVQHKEIEFVGRSPAAADYALLYDATRSRGDLSTSAELQSAFSPLATQLNSYLAGFALPVARKIWFGLNLLFVGLACLIAVRLFLPERRYFWPVLLATLACAGMSYPAMFLFNRGNIDGLLMLLLAAALYLWRPGRSGALGGGALALAIGLRTTPLLLAFPAVLRRGRRWFTLGLVAFLLIAWFGSAWQWQAWFGQNFFAHWTAWRLDENASFAALFQFAGNAARLHPFDPVGVYVSAAWAAGAGFALLFAFLDWHCPLVTRENALLEPLRLAFYLPLTLVLPPLAEPSMQCALVLLLPALAALYGSATRRWMRAGVLLASCGIALALMQAHALGALFGAEWPHILGSLGLLLALLGLLICRLEFAHAAVRAAAGRGEAGTTPFNRRAAAVCSEGRTHRRKTRALAFCRLGWRHLREVFVARNARQRAAYGVFAALLWMALMAWYALGSFHLVQAVFMLFAIVLAALAAGTASARKRWPSLGRELRPLAVAMLLLAPFYLIGLYWIPVQVNTDELIFIDCARRLVERTPLDLFTLDKFYFFFPSGSFIAIGTLANALGGIDLANVRLANGLFGWLCLPAMYLLARQFQPRRVALCAAVVLGASHTLIGLSRMAVRDNLPLLLELCALAVLFNAWKTRRRSLLILGGAIAGLGLYNYYSGRLIIIVWTAFVGALFLRDIARGWHDNWRPALWRAAAVMAFSVFGFLLSAGPMFVATWRMAPDSLAYSHGQLLLYPQGRQLLREWEGTEDTWQAFKNNVAYGLGMFNNNQKDRGNIYNNYGSGFVDPLTGVLLWLGVLRVVSARRRRAHHWLMLSGLLAIWLPMSFLATKNPGYSRMLVVLPFVVLLAVEGARAAARLLAKLNRTAGRSRLRYGLLRASLAGVVLCNVRIFHCHFEWARDYGDGAGNTIRYVDRMKGNPERAFYIVMGKDYPYFWFGEGAWKDWVAYVAAPPHIVELIPTADIFSGAQPKGLHLPASVLISREMWKRSGEAIRARYPRLLVRKITVAGEQLVLEIPASAETSATNNDARAAPGL